MGIIPVGVGFNHFRAGGGDELAEIEFESFGPSRLYADERLLNILVKSVVTRIGSGDGLKSLAEAEINLSTNRVRGVRYTEFRHAQVELLRGYIEVVKAVRAIRRMFKIVTV